MSSLLICKRRSKWDGSDKTNITEKFPFSKAHDGTIIISTSNKSEAVPEEIKVARIQNLITNHLRVLREWCYMTFFDSQILL